MNLDEMRQYVRETLESDNDEFSDFLVDQWIREGWLETHRHADWPFLDTTWELATAVAATPFDQIRDVAGAVPKWIRTVRSSRGELPWLQPDELQTELSFGAPGMPRNWAVRGGRTLLVSPRPNDTVNYVIQGYRKPTEWMTGPLGVPDLPEDLHVGLVYYALGRAFQRLDDPQSAIHHLDLFNAVLDSVARDLVSAQFGGSLVIGGGAGVRDRDVNARGVTRFSDPQINIVSNAA